MDKLDTKKAYYLKNKEKIKAASRKRTIEKREEISKRRKIYNKKVRDRAREYRLKYCEQHKEEIRQKKKEYNKKNHKRVLGWVTNRKLSVKKRTPAWADLKAIVEFYAACPEGHEVDHIIPLNGETVSGFHILENLQYLPRQENRKKSNKFTSALGSVNTNN